MHVDDAAGHDTEFTLAESERRLRFALESARQCTWEHEINSGKTFHSSMWKSVLGYKPDELKDGGDIWKSLVHPDDLPRVEQIERDHIEGPSSCYEIEFRMRHKDDHWVWLQQRGKVVERDASGQPTRLIGTHTDFTDRRNGDQWVHWWSQRVQLATKAGGIGLWEYDLKTGGLWWDEQMRSHYGLHPSEEVKYEHWVNLVHSDDRERFEEEVRQAIDSGRVYDTEFRVVLQDGSIRHIRSSADTLRDGDGEPYLMIGTNWDVTQTRELTTALKQERERLRVTLESIGDGVICTDTLSHVTFMNRAAEIETGWSQVEALGKPLEEVFNLIDEWTEAHVPSPVQECIRMKQAGASQEEVILINRDGQRQDIRCTAAPIQQDQGGLLGAVLVFQDVTKARQLQRKLAYSAAHDGLTDLMNRAAFERELRSACSSAATSKEVHAICFLDLDHFKAVNDTGGHAAGDEILRRIAHELMNCIRAADVAARLGGDEFALILRDCSTQTGVEIAEKVIAAICRLGVSMEGFNFNIGASIGVAAIDGAMTPSEVLSAADSACYDAKAAGRNEVRVFSAGLDETYYSIAG